ncbi:MAG: PorT family protein [Cytophagales bacterium]|nr:PorT family protein [Cytophagales bacterium]MDW8383402.1 porin family protein [Flammeovirgaceae bacterium]
MSTGIFTWIFIFLWGLFSVYCLQAQEVHYGVKGGLNMSTLVGDAQDDKPVVYSAEYKPTYHLGGFVNAKLSERFGIHTEILYSKQGAYDRSDKNPNQINYKFSYANFPIIAKYYPIENFHFDAGIQLSILLEANRQIGDSVIYIITQQLSSTDFGLCFGFGYELPNTSISINLRYMQGMNNIASNQWNPKEEKLANRLIQLSLGWAFH